MARDRGRVAPGSEHLLDVAAAAFRDGEPVAGVVQAALSSFAARFPPDGELEPAATLLMAWVDPDELVCAAAGPHLARIDAAEAWPDEARRFRWAGPVRVWRSASEPDVDWLRRPRPRSVELLDVRLADALGDAPLPPHLEGVVSDGAVLAAIRWTR